MIEVEIKSLLGDKAHADLFLARLVAAHAPELIAETTQRNHYFLVHDKEILLQIVKDLVDETERGEAEEIFQQPGVSLRTREIDGTKVLLVLKASIGDDTSANGVARKELEKEIPLTLGELDTRLLAAAHVQAKWSRSRKEYGFDVKKGVHVRVTLDKNAGYGFLAELEMVVPGESDVEEAHSTLVDLMRELAIEELPQDRLERMFAHYNEHWERYYGTDETFMVD